MQVSFYHDSYTYRGYGMDAQTVQLERVDGLANPQTGVGYSYKQLTVEIVFL